DRKVRAFSAVPGQVGAVFAINNEVIGLDLFDSPSTFRKLLGKLVNSYALQALAGRSTSDKAEADDKFGAGDLIRFVIEAKAQSFAAIGEGQDVRIQGENLAAAALVAKDRLVHLCAFRIKENR